MLRERFERKVKIKEENPLNEDNQNIYVDNRNYENQVCEIMKIQTRYEPKRDRLQNTSVGSSEGRSLGEWLDGEVLRKCVIIPMDRNCLQCF